MSPWFKYGIVMINSTEGTCSNARCTRPKPGDGRCISCQALLTGALVRHRYQIKKTIGRGGFGTTYLVADQDCFNEDRILKELRPHDFAPEQDENAEDTALRLFKREAQVLLTLEHAGIPKLYAFFNEGSYSYLVQDFIPGQTLAEEVEARQRNFDEEEARQTLIELADILAYLHAHQPPIIHRDIKPQNLMRHADGRLLLIDFGAVCQAASNPMAKRTLIGSPGYSPPEQIFGHPVPQSDLYAAGATVVRLMSGMHPSQLFNFQTKHLEWHGAVEVSEEFAAVLDLLLAREVSKRLPSAQELKEHLLALGRAQQSAATSAEQPGASEPTRIFKDSAANVPTTLFPDHDTRRFSIDTALAILGDEQALERPPFDNSKAVDESGDLASMPILFLLRRFYCERLSGLLTCTQGESVKTIHFDHGMVVFANSTLRQERLGEMLLRMGRISIDEFEQAAALMRLHNLRLGSALVEMGCITSEELRPLIVRQVSNIIYSLFNWTEGRYDVRRQPVGEETIKISISTADIIFEGLRRVENIDLVKRWLGDFTRKLATTTDPLLLYQVVNLNPKEAFIVSRIDSIISVEEILSLGGLPEAETLKTICGLLAVGILEWVGEQKESVRKDTGELQPALAVSNLLGEPPLLPSDIDIQTAAAFCYEVENTLRTIENASHYAVLGIERGAGNEELREAYARLAKKFHPDRHAQLVNYNLSLRDDLEKIFNRISEAYRVLSSRRAREEYDRNLRTSPHTNSLREALEQHRVSHKVALGAVKTETPRAMPAANSTPAGAQRWFEKGLEYYNQSQFEHACRAFWAATETAPQMAEYRLYLARTLAMIKGSAGEAEQEFHKAIALAPDKAAYYVELGLFYQKLNMLKKAEKMFDQALSIDPEQPVALRAKKAQPTHED